MSFRFLSDQCVPAGIVRELRHHGHEVILLRDVLPIRAADPEVIAAAQSLDCLLLSLNGDFSDIVAYPPRRYNGIVSIQLHNHPEIISQVMDRLIAYLNQLPNSSSLQGKLLIVESHRIRVR
jgi:predicted nuclease of predicted toxin-antitoxin system